MAHAHRRQRAYYRKKLEAWERGEWQPSRPWLQMVTDRFPELVAGLQDKHLGSDAAARLRLEHEQGLLPKPGARVRVALDGTVRRALVVAVDPASGMMTIDPDTFFNRLRVKLSQFWRRPGRLA